MSITHGVRLEDISEGNEYQFALYDGRNGTPIEIFSNADLAAYAFVAFVKQLKDAYQALKNADLAKRQAFGLNENEKNFKEEALKQAKISLKKLLEENRMKNGGSGPPDDQGP